MLRIFNRIILERFESESGADTCFAEESPERSLPVRHTCATGGCFSLLCSFAIILQYIVNYF